VVDISDPTSMSQVGQYDTPGSARRLRLEGTLLYVADTTGLQVLDISSPASPSLVANYVAPANAVARDVGGASRVYVAGPTTGGAAFHSLDTSTFTQSALHGSLAINAGSWGLAVRDDYAFTGRLSEVDVSDPISPSIKTSVPFSTIGAGRGVTLSGNYAFMASTQAGLDVVDVQDPDNLNAVSNYDTTGHVNDVAVSGNYAFLPVNDDGLHVLDVSAPTSLPADNDPDGSVSLNAKFRDIAVSGNFAFLAEEASLGLVRYDISTPTAPGNYNNYQPTSGVSLAYATSVRGGYPYVAFGSEGLVLTEQEVMRPKSRDAPGGCRQAPRVVVVGGPRCTGSR